MQQLWKESKLKCSPSCAINASQLKVCHGCFLSVASSHLTLATCVDKFSISAVSHSLIRLEIHEIVSIPELEPHEKDLGLLGMRTRSERWS